MKRIYLVKPSNRLIEAGTRQGAIAHVARSEMSASVATQHELVSMLQRGVKVEKSGEDVQVDIEEQVEDATQQAPEAPLQFGAGAGSSEVPRRTTSDHAGRNGSHTHGAQ